MVKILSWPNASALKAEGSCIALVIIYIKRDPFPDERGCVATCPHGLGVGGLEEGPDEGYPGGNRHQNERAL